MFYRHHRYDERKKNDENLLISKSGFFVGTNNHHPLVNVSSGAWKMYFVGIFVFFFLTEKFKLTAKLSWRKRDYP